ncbi:hypothetical protein IMZ29_00995 [Achromobacter sp. GG226]|uniref:hypothetical protein n=1 Tax=Verticiella alkaliphila TaxID=2779529 RepID=UPI001C0B8459|nr:hypothetical protein [Verticiella sp. GG226]MBU4609180.1 hypothetical protein [Verticiella sp. GG226]
MSQQPTRQEMANRLILARGLMYSRPHSRVDLAVALGLHPKQADVLFATLRSDGSVARVGERRNPDGSPSPLWGKPEATRDPFAALFAGWFPA